MPYLNYLIHFWTKKKTEYQPYITSMVSHLVKIRAGLHARRGAKRSMHLLRLLGWGWPFRCCLLINRPGNWPLINFRCCSLTCDRTVYSINRGWVKAATLFRSWVERKTIISLGRVGSHGGGLVAIHTTLGEVIMRLFLSCLTHVWLIQAWTKVSDLFDLIRLGHPPEASVNLASNICVPFVWPIDRQWFVVRLRWWLVHMQGNDDNICDGKSRTR